MPTRRLVPLLAALATLAALLAGHAGADEAGWRRDEPCGRMLGAPQASARPGCTAAHCASGPDGLQVCACRPDDAHDEPAVRTTVTKGGVALQSWDGEPMLGDTGAFRVGLADLDGDGRDEILVATLDAVSNGMAVQYWSACVVDGRDPSRERACVALADFPFLAMPTRHRGERGCRLLEAHWRWGSEPARGEGLYLVGRWHAWAGGKLTPDVRRPLVTRRYLYRFAAQRREAIEAARTTPIPWWRDPAARALRCPDRLCEQEEER